MARPANSTNSPPCLRCPMSAVRCPQVVFEGVRAIRTAARREVCDAGGAQFLVAALAAERSGGERGPAAAIAEGVAGPLHALGQLLAPFEMRRLNASALEAGAVEEAARLLLLCRAGRIPNTTRGAAADADACRSWDAPAPALPLCLPCLSCVPR